MTTTTLTVTKTGAVLRSSQSPNNVEELLPFKEIIDGLIKSTPTREITVVDYGDVWYDGPVSGITGKFSAKSKEFSYTDSVIYGTSRSDEIHDSKGSDTLIAGAGNDLIYISTGDDIVYGGPGTDSVYFHKKNLETLSFSRGNNSNEVEVFDNQTGENVTLIGVENVLFFGQGYSIDVLTN